jgi:hypothetical protein
MTQPQTSNTAGVRRQVRHVAQLVAAAVLLLVATAGAARAQCAERFVMAPDDRKATFGVGIMTGDASGAGTDGDIYVKL